MQVVDKKLEALLLSKKNAAYNLESVIKTLMPDISDDSLFTKDKKGAKGAVTLQSTKELLDLQFELYKISQQRKLKILDEEQNDTKNSFGVRMLLVEEFYKGSVELATKTAQHEIDADKTKLTELQANYAKAKGTEKNNLSVDIENEKRAITIATAKKNDAILELERRFNDEKDKIAKDEIDRQNRILDEALKSVKNVGEQQKAAIEASAAATMASLDTLLKEGKITQEQYDKRKAESIKQMNVLELEAQLKVLEGERNIMRLKQEDLTLIDSQIEKQKSLIISAQNADTDPHKKPLTGQEKRQQIVALAKDATDAIQNLVDIGYQKEIDAIQKIIELNNVRKDQEIANINGSTISAQEKAAQLIALDNKVAANNHKLAIEQNQIKVKQAKFDRDMAILKILEDVAGANFKLIAQGGFAGIAAGIAVGLQATAAIASLLAKPLPTVPAYAKGTDFHPGGAALVGEAGAERVDIPGQGSFIADRPMLLKNLPRGSKVTRDTINQDMQNSSGIAMSGMVQINGSAGNDVALLQIMEAILETGRQSVHTMKKQRGASVVVNVDNGWGAYITKSVKD